MDIPLVAKANSPKSHMIFHEDPEKLHIGTLPEHAYFIPFAKGQDPFDEREQSQRLELLNGEWNFRYYDSILSLEDDFINQPFTETIPVPSNWQLYGYDRAQYTNIVYPIPFDPPFVPDNIPVGVYQRKYCYTCNGMRRILTFEGVDSCIYLYINYAFAGYSQVSHHTSEFDITDFLNEGENTITAAVLKWCDGTYLEDQDKLRLSGIFRDVYVQSRPQNRLTDYRIKTILSADTLSSTLEIELIGANVELTLSTKDNKTILNSKIQAGQKHSFEIDAPFL